MNKKDKATFDNHYQQLLKFLKLQAKAKKTIDSYSRELHQVRDHSNYLHDALTSDVIK